MIRCCNVVQRDIYMTGRTGFACPPSRCYIEPLERKQ